MCRPQTPRPVLPTLHCLHWPGAGPGLWFPHLWPIQPEPRVDNMTISQSFPGQTDKAPLCATPAQHLVPGLAVRSTEKNPQTLTVTPGRQTSMQGGDAVGCRSRLDLRLHSKPPRDRLRACRHSR